MATPSTLSPTAELFTVLGTIADDESSIKKVLRYTKNLVARRQQVSKEKQELIDNLRESFHELKLYREGKIKFQTWEEVQKELRSDGTFD